MKINEALTVWYGHEKRDLPWRKTKDPYCVWVSEIILQQTRVRQGFDYYLRFMKRFPDVYYLAAAEIRDVLNLWEGLGYYSRARNLHKAAQVIVDQFDGKFPEDPDQLKSIPGIGDYTAAAIVSICFSKPFAVVDGNVYRVISRLFCNGTPIDSAGARKEFTAIAQEILGDADPGEFNQAIMELGALVCLPKSPHCEKCPISSVCCAYNSGSALSFPVKSRKVKKRDRYFHYFVIRYADYIVINKRDRNDIWEGLFEFPMIESTGDESIESVIMRNETKLILDLYNVRYIESSEIISHKLTHQNIFARFHTFEGEAIESVNHNDFKAVLISELENYPFPRLIHMFLQKR